jgi:hypothetical protein
MKMRRWGIENLKFFNGFIHVPAAVCKIFAGSARRPEAGSTDRSNTPEGCERAFAGGEGEVLVVENALF